jgi:hypothetical protein
MAIPSVKPQVAGTVLLLANIGVGSIIVTLSVTKHPLASVTVTLNIPEHKPVAVLFVCASGSSHV